MTLADYLRLLRAQWYVVAACAVLGIVAGLAVSAVVPPTYDARATLYFSTVVTGPASGTVSAYETNLLAQQQVNTTSLLVDTDRVAQEVIDDLRLPMTPAQLIPHLTADSDPDTVVLAVDATDPSPQRAADIANATGRALVRLTDTINKGNAAANLPTVLPSVRAQIIQAAVVPVTPSAGTRRANLAGGLLAGLLLGMALVLLRKLLDRRVRSGDELAALAGAPTMGATPRSASAKLRPVAVVDDPGGELAGAYRQLRVNVGVAMSGSQVLAVVSPGAGDGRSLAVCNLAVAFAESGCRVAVLEADLRNPRMSDHLGLGNEAGLAEVLAGTRTTSEVLRRWNGSVDVVLAGRDRSEPGHLIASHRFLTVLEELEADHDVVLVDTPAAAVASDVAVLGARSESVLLLARQGRTRKAEVERLVETLRLASGSIIGSVLTMEKGRRARRGSAPVPSPSRPAVAPSAAPSSPLAVSSSSPVSSTPAVPSPPVPAGARSTPVAAFDAPTLRNVAPVRTLTAPAPGSGSSTPGSSTPGLSAQRSPIAGSPIAGSSAHRPNGVPAPAPALPLRKRAVPQTSSTVGPPLPLPPLPPLPAFEDAAPDAAPKAPAGSRPAATPPAGTPTTPAGAPNPPPAPAASTAGSTPGAPAAKPPAEAPSTPAASTPPAAVQASAAAAPSAPVTAPSAPGAAPEPPAKPAAAASSRPSPAPTSPAPKTTAPKTAAPTTAAAKTAAPKTAAPTTAAPTTPAPTTSAPTTPAPTTSAPTTS